MDLTGGKDVIAPAEPTAERNEHPAGYSFKRRPSPPLKNRVLVLDAEGNTIDVFNKKEFKKRNSENYQEVKIPRYEKQLTVFVDPYTESKATTERETNGHSNVMLAKIYLDQLNFTNRVLRAFKQLSTLYITNLRPPMDDCSTDPTIESDDHSA